jgi:hypothetical protein
MKKPNPLMAGLQQFDRKGATPPPVSAASSPVAATVPAPSTPRAVKTRSREGAVQIAAFFPEEVRAQLKVLAAEQRREVQDLMAEALNLIFVKYGKAEIAPRKSE